MAHIFAMGGGWGADGLHGTKVTTAADILDKAGINFTVEGRPVYTMDAKGQPVKIPGKKAIVNTESGRVYTVAGEGYEIVQFSDAVNLLDTAAYEGACIYTSAGVFKNGARAFITAALPQEIRIGKEDVIKPYLGVFTSFDGSTPVYIKGLTFRPICENTAQAALETEHGAHEFVIRHTVNAVNRMKLAMEALTAAGYTFRKLGETYQALAATRFTTRDMQALAAVLAPAKDESDVSKQTQETREVLVTLFEQGRGQKEYSDIRGTAWAAYNAVTEYVDHIRPSRGENETEARTFSALFASGAEMKEQAFTLVQAAIGR